MGSLRSFFLWVKLLQFFILSFKIDNYLSCYVFSYHLDCDFPNLWAFIILGEYNKFVGGNFLGDFFLGLCFSFGFYSGYICGCSRIIGSSGQFSAYISGRYRGRYPKEFINKFRTNYKNSNKKSLNSELIIFLSKKDLFNLVVFWGALTFLLSLLFWPIWSFSITRWGIVDNF